MVKQWMTGAAVVLLTAGAALAQTPQNSPDQVRARQRILTMEAVLEQAVSNGAANVVRQVRDMIGDQPMLAGAPQVRGFTLEGYGVLFDVEVPQLRLPLIWPLRYMIDDSRAASAAAADLRMLASTFPPEQRTQIERIARELEGQAGGVQTERSRGTVSAALAAPGAPAPPAPPADPAMADDPDGAYTREVKSALIDAMVENSGSLPLAPDDWLIIGARRNSARDPLFPSDSIDVSTWILRVRGRDLAEFRAGRLTLEDIRKRVEVREY